MFTETLDTPKKIEAYQGEAAADAARAFLNGIDKDTPATPESVNEAVEDVIAGPDDGQDPGDPDPTDPNPGDPDPGDPEPEPVVVTVRDATLSEIAMDDGGINMWKGRGITADHFSV